MANDDWRFRIELDDEAAGGLLERLERHGSDAEELAQELESESFAATRGGSTVFVYASSALQLEKARHAIDAELEQLGAKAREIVREHWLGSEDHWDDEPADESLDEETVGEGYAPWEVRIPCESHHAARELADRLAAEGYGVVRRWRYVIAGTATKEQADELAHRLHGTEEPGGALVYEVAPRNRFAIFGGLGGS